MSVYTGGDLMGKFFEDLTIGEKYTSAGRTITESDITRFAGLSGDYNPLHTDKEFAKESQFKQRIAHGALTFSVMTGLWDQLGIVRETVVAFYGVNSMRFVNPVHIGDTLHMHIEIIKKEERKKDGVVTLLNTVFNQNNAKVMICEALLLMKKH
jgi:3-hydroxybutyryl-CoA dehydratase